MTQHQSKQTCCRIYLHSMPLNDSYQTNLRAADVSLADLGQIAYCSQFELLIAEYKSSISQYKIIYFIWFMNCKVNRRTGKQSYPSI